MRGMAYRVYRPVSWPLELRSFSRPFRDYSFWGADPGAQAPGYSRKSLRDRTASHWRATVPAGRLGEFGANHREKIRAARQRSPTGGAPLCELAAGRAELQPSLSGLLVLG